MKNLVDAKNNIVEKLSSENGAIGYLFAWLLGVPVSILLLVFLFRAL